MSTPIKKRLKKTVKQLRDILQSHTLLADQPANVPAFLQHETRRLIHCCRQLQECLAEDLPQAVLDDDQYALDDACQSLRQVIRQCRKGQQKVDQCLAVGGSESQWQMYLDFAWQAVFDAFDDWLSELEMDIILADDEIYSVPDWDFDTEFNEDFCNLAEFIEQENTRTNVPASQKTGCSGLTLLAVLFGIVAIEALDSD